MWLHVEDKMLFAKTELNQIEEVPSEKVSTDLAEWEGWLEEKCSKVRVFETHSEAPRIDGPTGRTLELPRSTFHDVESNHPCGPALKDRNLAS